MSLPDPFPTPLPRRSRHLAFASTRYLALVSIGGALAAGFVLGRATAVDSGLKAQVVSIPSVLAKNAPDKDEAFRIIPLVQGQDASATVVRAEKELKPHYHESREEIAYIIRGGGTMQMGGQKRPVKPGDLIYLPRGQVHGFLNGARTDTVILSIMSPPFDGKDRHYIEPSKPDSKGDTVEGKPVKVPD